MSTVTVTKVRRGRPALELVLPAGNEFTFTEVHAVNPHIKCDLSIYHKVGKLISRRVLRRTTKTVPSGGENNVGKPLEVLQRVEAFRRSRAAKRAARTRRENALTA